MTITIPPKRVRDAEKKAGPSKAVYLAYEQGYDYGREDGIKQGERLGEMRRALAGLEAVMDDQP